MLRKLNGQAVGTLNSSVAGSIPARGAKFRKIMGAAAYNLFDDFAGVLQGSVVEIGTERGEGSTQYLIEACKKAGNKFYTVDFDYNAPSFPAANQFRMTGEVFFEDHFPKEEKICFAYLDGFDWIYEEVDGWIPDWIPEQIEYYSRYGLEMNNENSQLSHLTISKAVAEHAAKKCVILFDDTFYHLNTEQYDGKGGEACYWLLEQGWYEVSTNVYEAKAFRNWK